MTDATILADPDLGIKAAAIAAAGPAVALHVRDRTAPGAALAGAARRLLTLARPPEAAVLVNARPDLAAAVGADGVQLAATDLSPADARRVFRKGWIGRSVHNEEEAEDAVAEGADFLLVGTVFPTSSHPGRAAAGLDLIKRTAALGKPVIAIGGVGPARVAEVHAAGAYGVAAISALWTAPDPAAAVLAMLDPWMAAS